LRDDRPLRLLALRLEPPHVLEADEALTAGRSAEAKSARGLPPAKRVHRDTDELGRFANANRNILRFSAVGP
jgi:hypothetical protein